MTKLNFSKGNRKLNELASDMGLKKSQVISFDLPAGHTCPMARLIPATLGSWKAGLVGKQWV